MNATRKNTFAVSTQGEYSRELSERVKRLELLRVDACAHRDRVRVAFIDRQIQNTVLEWCDSYVTDFDARAVCRSPSSTMN